MPLFIFVPGGGKYFSNLYLSQVVGNICSVRGIFVQFLYLYLCQVVGREKEERGPPLPDLLQVISLIVKANCDCSNVEGENKLFDDLKAFYDS